MKILESLVLVHLILQVKTYPSTVFLSINNDPYITVMGTLSSRIIPLKNFLILSLTQILHIVKYFQWSVFGIATFTS